MRRIALLTSIVAIVAAMALAPASRADAWGTLVTGTYTCAYGKITFTLTWYGNSPYAAGQYVEMSYTDNGWKRHTTTTVGPFSPKVNTMTWDGLAPNTRHFLRFTQQYWDGSWDASSTFRFDTPGCNPNVIYNTMGALGDYDCLGGEGDGPNYVEGEVQVRYYDPYRLDADNNGIGCQEGDE